MSKLEWNEFEYSYICSNCGKEYPKTILNVLSENDYCISCGEKINEISSIEDSVEALDNTIKGLDTWLIIGEEEDTMLLSYSQVEDMSKFLHKLKKGDYK